MSFIAALLRREKADRPVGVLIEGVRTFGRGIVLIMQAAPQMTTAYFFVVIAASLLPVIQVWLVKEIVDRLAGSGSGMASAMLPAAIYAGLLVALAGLDPVGRALVVWLRDRTVAEIDRQLMSAGSRLGDLVQIEQPAFHDRLRLFQNIDDLPMALFQFIQFGLGTALTLSGLLLLLTHLHPIIPLVLVVMSVPNLLIAGRMDRIKYDAMVRRSRAAREMDYCARITADPLAAKEVRLFGLGEFFLERFRERFAHALREVTQERLEDLRRMAVGTGLYGIALVGSFWFVTVQARNGNLALGDVALYLAAITQAGSRLMVFSRSFSDMHQAVLLLQGLFDFLDEAHPTIAVASHGRSLPAPSTLSGGIAMQGLSFRYPHENSSPALVDITAFIPPGKVTALVGVNGAGKSTLVKILTRMYDPQGGVILLDGTALANYDLPNLRARMAVVYQDFARFALTLRENVAVAVSAQDAVMSRDGIEGAARRAGLDAVAAKLPQGYDTELTRNFENGVELSGGEWQKVALGRGFARDAALVILDEPSAALDAEAEWDLFARFRKLGAGKTVLLISHRFSTLRQADHVVVIEDGRVVEAGGHDELLDRNGRYATLFAMQADRYREDAP